MTHLGELEQEVANEKLNLEEILFRIIIFFTIFFFFKFTLFQKRLVDTQPCGHLDRLTTGLSEMESRDRQTSEAALPSRRLRSLSGFGRSRRLLVVACKQFLEKMELKFHRWQSPLILC